MRRRESQSAIRIIPLQHPIVRSPCVRCAHRKLHRLTSLVFEANASFLCGRHFLRAFSSRCCCPRNAHRQRTYLSYARQNNVVRNLSQTFLIAVGIEARAKRSAAPTPFASPYCPCRAQIRRAHVQPRTRLAVHPSMRVRESCLTSSPRASLHDSQNPGWSFLAREASE